MNAAIRSVKRLTLTVTVLLGSSILLADDFWPGWLGPNRDGWVSGFDVPDQWPEVLKRGWSVDVGTGYGSPLIANERVYQHARQGDQEVLLCLELLTGQELWRNSHDVPFKMGGGGEWHGKGPKSCPAYADGRIFTMSIRGELTAIDADAGALLWRSNYGSEFQPNHPYWGASTSPIVAEDRVIVHFGNDDVGTLVALDVASGQELWRQGDDGAAYSSPLILTIGGVLQVVEWNHNVVAGVELETGKRLWEFPMPHEETNQNMPTPAFHDGCLIVGGENRGIRSIQPVLRDGRWSAEQKWIQEAVALDMSSAVVNDGMLFGFSHYSSGQLFCLDCSTGEVRWKGPGRAGQNATFLSVPGHVLCLFDRGELKVIKASPDGLQTVADWTVAERPTWSPPVLLQRGVLIKDQTSLSMWPLVNASDR